MSKVLILFILNLICSGTIHAKEALLIKIHSSQQALLEEISFRELKGGILYATNTWNSQKNKNTELGIYKIPPTKSSQNNLKILKGYLRRLRNRNPQYKKYLDKTPHGEKISINDQVIDHKHKYYAQIRSILVSLINSDNKTCVKCANYTMNKKSIRRFVNGSFDKKFSLDDLKCQKKKEDQYVCKDNEFGVFKVVHPKLSKSRI